MTNFVSHNPLFSSHSCHWFRQDLWYSMLHSFSPNSPGKWIRNVYLVASLGADRQTDRQSDSYNFNIIDQSILFNLDATIQGPPAGPGSPPPDMFKLVHYEARTVGKRAVSILIECFLLRCLRVTEKLNHPKNKKKLSFQVVSHLHYLHTFIKCL